LIRLLVLSGSPDAFAAALIKERGVQVAETIPVQEKDIAAFQPMLRLMRREPVLPCAFGCKDFTLQRYQFFLKFYLLAAGPSPRILIDEGGEIRTVLWPSFLFLDIPRFLVELTASSFVLARAVFSILRQRIRTAPVDVRKS